MAHEETSDVKQPVTLTWESDANQVIVFDATLREGHTSRSQLTAYPIESGADHTDHIRRLPDELSLEVVVTDDPLVVDRQANATPANTGGDAKQRAVSAYNFLVEVKDKGRLVRIFTTLRDYRNMAIESIDVIRDVGTSRIVQANLELREILIAVTEQVDAPTPSVTRAAPSRNKKKNRGKKNKDKTSDANKAKSTSVAQKLLSGLGVNL